LYLIKVGVLRVSASFGVVSGIYLTLDLELDGLSFLRVRDEEVGGFVLTIFKEGFVVGIVVVVFVVFVIGVFVVVLASFSSSSCF
jgi:hypothetical protein